MSRSSVVRSAAANIGSGSARKTLAGLGLDEFMEEVIEAESLHTTI